VPECAKGETFTQAPEGANARLLGEECRIGPSTGPRRAEGNPREKLIRIKEEFKKRVQMRKEKKGKKPRPPMLKVQYNPLPKKGNLGSASGFLLWKDVLALFL